VASGPFSSSHGRRCSLLPQGHRPSSFPDDWQIPKANLIVIHTTKFELWQISIQKLI
jgi:hypothetical protein